MKKLLSLISLLTIIITSEAQVPKKVVVEHFTNTKCSICASRNPGFYTNLWNHPGILHISYHPSSPYATCYLNNHNVSENDDRTKFYGQYGGTPKFTIQGENIPSSQSTSNASLFTPFTGMSAEASIRVSHVKYPGDSIQVMVSVKTETSHSYGNLKLFVALVEDTIAYNAPNGEDFHYDVFRKALSNIEGDALLLPSNVGDSLTFNYSAPYNFDWDFKRIYAMVILQDEDGLKVVQSEASASESTGRPVGIKQIDEIDFQIFPNPVQTTLQVELKNEVDFVRLFDLKGYEVYRSPKLESGRLSIDVSERSPGLYFLEIVSGQLHSVQKVLVR